MAIVTTAMIALMTRTKSMEPDQNAAMRAMVRRLVEERFEGNRTKAATAFGVSQPYLYEFLETESRGAGMKLLRGVAAYLHVAIDDVVAGREKAPEPRSIINKDQYPARAQAAAAARLLGVGEEGIRYVLTPEDWFEKMRSADKDFKRGWMPEEVRTAEPDPGFDEEPPINKRLDKRGRGKK